MFTKLMFLVFAFGLIQTNAVEEIEMDIEIQRTLDVKELELLNKLLSPNDTTLQQETKTLLAHYLVTQALAEAEKKANGGMMMTSSTNTPDVVATNGPEVTSQATSTEPTTPSTTLSLRNESSSTESSTSPSTSEATSTTTQGPPPRVTPSQEHVLNQVDKILQNVASGNVVGIVDESLAIRAPNPVRNLVNGILTTIFCNPIDRLFNRCRPSASSPNRVG